MIVVLLVITGGVATASTSIAYARSATDAYAATAPRRTLSLYVRSLAPRALYAEGRAAGRESAEGIVILDFGRPAYRDGVYGVLWGARFASFARVVRAVRSYVNGYFLAAPAYTSLDIGVGTNNSCGTGQPCGSIRCGCSFEPASYYTWGEAFASVVEGLDGWIAALKARFAYTDEVSVVGADDAEPAFDPGYANTASVLEGYAEIVGTSGPALVDYGSAEPSYWSEAQLFQVAFGFGPDTAMPEIYYPVNARQWAALVRFGEVTLHRSVTIQGVLTMGAGSNTPRAGYAEMLAALSGVSGQHSIPWLSLMRPAPRRWCSGRTRSAPSTAPPAASSAC